MATRNARLAASRRDLGAALAKALRRGGLLRLHRVGRDAPRLKTPRHERRVDDDPRRINEDEPRRDDDDERHLPRRAGSAMAPDAASHGTDADAAGLRPRDDDNSAAAGELRRRRGFASPKNVATKELARRKDFRRLVAPRFSSCALGAVRTSATVFEEVVVAPRPLRDRGLRPDGGQARAVVGDAARRLPRGLVRTGVIIVALSGGRSDATRRQNTGANEQASCRTARRARRRRGARPCGRSPTRSPAVTRSSAGRSARAAWRTCAGACVMEERSPSSSCTPLLDRASRTTSEH